MRRCENCVFFHTDPDHCRRTPPRAFDAGNAGFPVVNPKWNCGEHKFSLLKWLKSRKIFGRTQYQK